MFKLKVSLLYALVVLALAAGAVFVVNGRAEDARAAAESALQRARAQMLRDMRLHELELQEAARELASGRLAAYMESLDQFREQLLQLQVEVYEAHPPCAANDRHCEAERVPLREALVRESEALLDGFTETLARMRERVVGEGQAWAGRSREDFVGHHREMLVVCAAISFENCAFRFTYFPLREEMERLQKHWKSRLMVDLALVANAGGVGLADADDPLWSDVEDFGAKHPVVAASRVTGSARDVVLHGRGSPGYHVVAAAPIRHGSQFLGTLLIGTEINEDLVKRVAIGLGVGVTYVRGREALLSTLPERDYRDLLGSFDYASEQAMALRADGHLASSIPYLGNASDNEVRVVLSLDLAAVEAPFGAIRLVLLVGTALLLLFGLGLGQYILQAYVRPFVVIDAGIHEVIAGNPDYQFSFDMPDKLASNMAQSLNLMVAVLRGRPLPEEAQAEAWDERLLIDQEDEVASCEDDELAELAPATGAAGRARAQELLAEPADVYYRRLHAEFVAARQRIGAPSDGVTYVRFVEKLARSERRIKDRIGCRYVRFEVTLREGHVMLTPIPIP